MCSGTLGRVTEPATSEYPEGLLACSSRLFSGTLPFRVPRLEPRARVTVMRHVVMCPDLGVPSYLEKIMFPGEVGPVGWL